MQIQYSAAPPADSEIVVELLTKEERDRTAVAVPAAEFSGAANGLLLLHAERRLYVGLGAEAKVTAQTVRAACGAAAKALRSRGRARATLALGRVDGVRPRSRRRRGARRVPVRRFSAAQAW